MSTTHKIYPHRRYDDAHGEYNFKWYEKLIIAAIVLLLIWVIHMPQEEIGAVFDKVFMLKPQAEYVVPASPQQPQTTLPQTEDLFGEVKPA